MKVLRNGSSLATNGNLAYAELDSHSDTCVFGKDALVLELYDQKVNVHPFHPDLGHIKSAPIAKVAIAYDDPRTGETTMLIIDQCIYVKDIEGGLLSPFQLRAFDIEVNYTARQFVNHVDEHTHAIVTSKLVIPLELHGIRSSCCLLYTSPSPRDS